MDKTKVLNRFKWLICAALCFVMLFTIMPVNTPAYADGDETEDETYTVTFDANGGFFDNGSSTQNVVTYGSIDEDPDTVYYSHTSNVDDAGNQNGGYVRPGRTGTTYQDTITIDGADSLLVTVTYQLYRYYSTYDQLYVVPGTTYTSGTYPTGWRAFSERSNTAGAHGSLITTTFAIPGDSVTFAFVINAQNTTYMTAGYGYYAVVTKKPQQDVEAGSYKVPTHGQEPEYTFASWNDQPDGSGNTYDPETDVIRESKTLYAQYKQQTDLNITWATCGTCEWGIDKNSCLWIRPKNGAASGTLASWAQNPPWINVRYPTRNTFRSVKIVNTVKARTCSWMFYYAERLTSVDLAGLDTSSVTNMTKMFYGCKALKTVDLSMLKTDRVKTMDDMFYMCYALESLDLSGFDTRAATNMGNMFPGSVEFGDRASYDQSKLTSVVLGPNFRFNGNGSATPAKLHGQAWVRVENGIRKTPSELQAEYDTNYSELSGEWEILPWWRIDSEGVLTIGIAEDVAFTIPNNTNTSMSYASYWPWNGKRSQVKAIQFVGDVSLGSNKDLSYMFNDFENLETADLTGFHTEGATKMAYMFADCDNLRTIDFGNDFETSSVTTMAYMFSGCGCLEEVDASDFDTSAVTTTAWMFSNCSSLERVSVDGFDTSSVTTMANMFSGCNSLTELDVTGFDTSSVTSMTYMFNGCNSLTELDVTSFDTSSVKNMAYMFCGCRNLSGLDVTNFDTGAVQSMAGMFKDCQSISEIDVTGFDTHSVQNMSGMFSGMYSLTSLDVTSFDTSSVTKMGNDTVGFGSQMGMFTDCKSLQTLDLSNFDTSNVTAIGAMFAGCTNLKSVDLSNFDTQKVTYMIEVFKDCASLESLDLNGFDTSRVTRFDSMFTGCQSLSDLNISSFNTKNATRMQSMFLQCNNLKRVTLGEDFDFNGNNITTVNYKAILPEPPTPATTGKWIREDGAFGPFTSTELRDQYGTNAESWAGTWVWEVDATAGTIRFMGNGGVIKVSSFVSQTGEFEPVPVLKDPDEIERPGYYVIGWNTEADGSGTSYGPKDTVMPVQGTIITLYAQWKIDTRVEYTVKHYQQNTDATDYYLADTEVFKEEPGEDVTPDFLVYDDFLEPEEHKTITLSENAEENLVEYYYPRKYYFIQIDGNGADSGSIDPLKVYVGQLYTLPNGGYGRTNYRMIGYNTAADMSGEPYLLGQKVIDLAGHNETFTLYVQWFQVSEDYEAKTDELYVHAKAGQTIVIPGLPDGTTYTVEEVNIPEGWTLTSSDGTMGVIHSNETSTATFENTYTATGSAYIVAHKRFDGDQLQSGQFTFQLIDNHGQIVATATNGSLDTEETITNEEGIDEPNPWYNTAPIFFPNLSFSNPGEYTYTVREVVLGSSTTIVYDEHEDNVLVNVVDNGDGTLSSTVAYDEDGALFVNRVVEEGKCSFSITKSVVNETLASADTEFEFQVILRNYAGEELTQSYEYNLYPPMDPIDFDRPKPIASGTVASGDTVTLTAGQMVTVSGLPANCQYEVIELPAPGWELTESSNTSGTLTPRGIPPKAMFKNTYSASGALEIEASKVYVGGELIDGMFQYELLNGSFEVIDQVGVNADGTIKFNPIYFTFVDDGTDLVYYIREVNDGQQKAIYDDSQKTVLVHVSDNGLGEMVFDVESEDTVFTNTKLVDVTIEVHTGGNMGSKTEEFPFTITLTNEDGTPYTGEIPVPDGVTGWTEVSEGVYTFYANDGDSVTLELPHGTSYTVSEDPGPYSPSVNVTEGDDPTIVNSDNPVVSGTVDGTKGDTTIVYTNRLSAIVPTGINVAAPIGFAVIMLFALVIMITKIKRKGQANA